MEPIPLEVIKLYFKAIKDQDYNIIKNLYYNYPELFLQPELLPKPEVLGSEYSLLIEDIPYQAWDNFYNFIKVMITEKLIYDLKQPSNLLQNELLTLGKFQYLASKEKGNQAGILVIKNSINLADKNNIYLIKVDSPLSLIKEILGSVLFRFFLDNESAPKNKLVLNSEDGQIYLISKFLPNFKDLSVIKELNVENITFINKFSNFYKLIAVTLLLRYDGLHDENLGVISTKNKAAVIDYGSILEFSEDETDLYENDQDPFFLNLINRCFIDFSTGQYFQINQYENLYKAFEETFSMFQDNKIHLKLALEQSFLYLEKYLPKETLELFFNLNLNNNYHNPSQGAEILIQFLDYSSYRIEQIGNILKFQDAISHMDFMKIRDLTEENPSLLYETLAFERANTHNTKIKPLEDFTPSEARDSLYLSKDQLRQITDYIGELREIYFEGFTSPVEFSV